MKTIDNGNTWISQISGTNKKLNSVSFANENTGYLVGDSSIALKTTDGGVNWNTLTTGVSANFTCLNYINDDIGFIAGSQTSYPFNTYLLKTTDGGITWDSLIFQYNSINSIAFSSGLYPGAKNPPEISEPLLRILE